MLKQFTISAAHTLNMGNYESMRVEASCTFDVDMDAGQEAFFKMKEEAQKELRGLLEQTYKVQRRKRKSDDESTGETA